MIKVEKATPYMLRNDGELFECGSIHPYVNVPDDKPFIYLENFIWFYKHTDNEETRELIEQIVNAAIQLGEITHPEEWREIDISKINNDTIYEEQLYQLLDLLEYETNQEFCRVRTSNIIYGGDNNDIYFRISSIGFNWFNLIWKVVAENSKWISSVTITRDGRTFNGGNSIYTINGKEINHLSTDEFLTLKGNPIIESIKFKNGYYDSVYESLSKGNSVIDATRFTPLHLIVKDYRYLKENCKYNFIDEGGNTMEKKINKKAIARKEFLREKIVKKGSKYQVQSEKGRNMGTYDTKKEAEDRLKQVEYFKHKDESLKEKLEDNPIDKLSHEELVRRCKKLNFLTNNKTDRELRAFLKLHQKARADAYIKKDREKKRLDKNESLNKSKELKYNSNEYHLNDFIDYNKAEKFANQLKEWFPDRLVKIETKKGIVDNISNKNIFFVEALKDYNKLKIIEVNPEYTSGGIYMFTGKLSDGTYFFGDTDYFDLRILNENPADFIYGDDSVEWQEEHLIRDLDNEEARELFKTIINWVIKYEPNGNYNLYDMQKVLYRLNHNHY